MAPVYYCREHETCVTERVEHREDKIKIPTWQDGDVNIDGLRDKGVDEVTILDILYQYNTVGIFEGC